MPAAPTLQVNVDSAAISEAVQRELKNVGLPDLVEQIKSLGKVDRRPLEEIKGASGPERAIDRDGYGAPSNGGIAERRGRNVAKACLAIAASAMQKGRIAPEAWAAKQYGQEDAVTKALTSATESGGGALIDETLSEDFVELLYPQTTVMALGPRIVPLDQGTLLIPKMTSGSAGGWIGENSNATATQPAFGQLRLVARKYAALVPVSNDLVRRAGPRAESMVRDDLIKNIAKARDLAFLRGDGNNGQPRGLKNWASTSAPDNVFDANSTVNLANVTADLGTAVQLLMDSNVGLTRPGWIIEPRTWRYLYTVRDGNGNYAFRDEMNRGMLFGFPFKWTSQIPRTLGSGNKAEVYFADFDDIVVGEATQVMIDASDTAAYHDGSNVQAAFSLDQTVVRAIVETDLIARRRESIVLIEAVAWGV